MHRQQARELISQIRINYPYPVKCMNSLEQAGKYCVGGAFCRYVQQYMAPETAANNLSSFSDFPEARQLANILKLYNNRVDILDLNRHAVKIINANDMNDFEEAYKCLETALTDN